MSEHLLDLAAAERVAEGKRSGWERDGLTVELKRWPATDKPAASLFLTGARREGDLTYWVSEESELAYVSSPKDVVQRHEDGVTVERIGALMDELASRVREADDVPGVP